MIFFDLKLHVFSNLMKLLMSQNALKYLFQDISLAYIEVLDQELFRKKKCYDEIVNYYGPFFSDFCLWGEGGSSFFHLG